MGFFQNVGNVLTGGALGLISDTINNARQKRPSKDNSITKKS